MTSFPDSSKKLFGNCEVEWRIDKFSLQTSTKNWFIESPEFTVNGYEETKWSMNLRSKPVNKSNLVLFSVRRSDIDSGPKYIQLNVKISCMISDAKSFCFNDELLSLKNGSNYEECLGSIEEFLTEKYCSDNLITIFCDMIVYCNSASKEFGECSHPGLKLLSKNMFDLYKSARNFDTKLIIGDDVILVHKAILCSRNEYLNDLIEMEDDDDVDEFTVIKFDAKLDYKAMRKVLAYLYSGDKRHVLEKPSFAIYHCASFLEISEIETLYQTDKLILQSTVDFEEYLYTLRGYEFENSSFSWGCDTEEFSKTYRLLFYPKKDSSEDYIPLFTKVFEKSMLARIEFSFVNQIIFLCAKYLITEEDVCINTDTTINTLLRNLASHTHTTIEIKINLKLSAGIKMSYVDERRCLFVSCINEDFYYERLSSDLEYLLDGGPFVDTVIDNNGTYFWVHKCILASRSRLFSDILKTIEEGEAVVVSNIEPHVVSVILTYIYSGLLSDVMDADVIEVYKAAVVGNLPQLKSMCSDWLKLSFKTNRNIRCRTLRIAENYEDESLMKSVLNHLFEKQEVFLMSRSLHSFQDVSTCRHCLLPS